MSLTSEQLRAARAMLRLDQIPLAERSGVSVESIRRFERMDGEIKAQESTLASLRLALERSGIVFLDDKEGSPRGGPGVRLAEKSDADQWNEQLRKILDALVDSLEMAVEDRGIKSAEMTEAILEARQEAYDFLERDVRDENTTDMIDELHRQDYDSLFAGGERGLNAVKRRPRRITPDQMKKLRGDESE